MKKKNLGGTHSHVESQQKKAGKKRGEKGGNGQRKKKNPVGREKGKTQPGNRVELEAQDK